MIVQWNGLNDEHKSSYLHVENCSVLQNERRKKTVKDLTRYGNDEFKIRLRVIGRT